MPCILSLSLDSDLCRSLRFQKCPPGASCAQPHTLPDLHLRIFTYRLLYTIGENILSQLQRSEKEGVKIKSFIVHKLLLRNCLNSECAPDKHDLKVLRMNGARRIKQSMIVLKN